MKDANRSKKRLYTLAIAFGLALGSMGIATAASDAGTPVPPAEDDVEVQEPSYTGSVQAPAGDESLSEADESAQLEALATITADEAAALAQAAVAGEVVKVELDNENGSVVYSVEIIDASGADVDVKVDVGNGVILNTQSDGDHQD